MQRCSALNSRRSTVLAHVRLSREAAEEAEWQGIEPPLWFRGPAQPSWARHRCANCPSQRRRCIVSGILRCENRPISITMQRYRRLLAVAEQHSGLRQYRMSIRDASSQSQSWGVEQAVKQGVSKAASMFENAVAPGSAWSPEKMPDLTGKTYLVTGANSGIGFQAAKQLAQSNATVTIASRNEASGQRCDSHSNTYMLLLLLSSFHLQQAFSSGQSMRFCNKLLEVKCNLDTWTWNPSSTWCLLSLLTKMLQASMHAITCASVGC